MVDDRVPGVVEVTPAQVEATKALVKYRGAVGRPVDSSIRAIAGARRRRYAQAEISASLDETTELAKHAMLAIGDLERVRQELSNGDPEVEKRLDELNSAAVQAIQGTLLRSLRESSHDL